MQREDQTQPQDSIYPASDFNYLSYSYLESGVVRFHQSMTKLIANEIVNHENASKQEEKETNFESPPTLIPLHEIEGGKAPMLLKSLLNQLSQTTGKFLDEIRGQHVAEDSAILMVYFKDINALIQNANNVLHHLNENEKVQSELKSFLKKLAGFCIANVDYLVHAVDVSIYEVVIPKEEYKNFMKGSGHFHLEGTGKSIAKVVAASVGSVVTGAAALTEIAFFPVLIFDGANMDFALFKASTGGFLKSVETLHKFNTNQSYVIKNDISSEWIRGKVIGKISPSTNNNKEPQATLVTKNPHFKEAEGVKMYIIDGKDPQKIFAEGTNYNLGKGKGKLLVFERISDAILVAKKRAKGEFYDMRLGWRDQNTWSDTERKNGKEAEEIKRQSKVTPQS